MRGRRRRRPCRRSRSPRATRRARPARHFFGSSIGKCGAEVLADDGHELVDDEAAEGVAARVLVVAEGLVEHKEKRIGPDCFYQHILRRRGSASWGRRSGLAVPLERGARRAETEEREAGEEVAGVKRVVAHLKARRPSSKAPAPTAAVERLGRGYKLYLDGGCATRPRGAARARPQAECRTATTSCTCSAQSELLSGEPKAARDHFHELTLMPSRFSTVAKWRIADCDWKRATSRTRAKATRRCCRRRTIWSSRRWRASASARRWRKRARCRPRSSSGARSTSASRCIRSPRRRWRGSRSRRRRRSRPRSASRARRS